jgi:hypothetical protein
MGRVNATDKSSARGAKYGKNFHCAGAARPTLASQFKGGADLAHQPTMTIIPKDSDIAAVVVLLGAVLITGLLRAFSF